MKNTINQTRSKLSFSLIFWNNLRFMHVWVTGKKHESPLKISFLHDLRMLQKQQKYFFFKKKTCVLKSRCYGSLFSTKNIKMETLTDFSVNVPDTPPISRFFINSRIFTFFSFFCANLTFDRKKIFSKLGGYLIHRRKKKLISRFSIFFQNKCILVYWEFNFFSKICFFSCFFPFFCLEMLIEKTQNSCFLMIFWVSSYSVWGSFFVKKSIFFVFFTVW